MKSVRWHLLVVIALVACGRAGQAEDAQARAVRLVAEAREAITVAPGAHPRLPGSAASLADDRLVQLRRELLALGPVAVRVLLEEPKADRAWELLEWQLETIRRMGGAAIPELAAALRDPSKTTRVNALNCLADLDDAVAARALVAAMQEEGAPIRSEAAGARFGVPPDLASDPRIVYLLTVFFARKAGEADAQAVIRSGRPVEVVLGSVLGDCDKKVAQVQEELKQATRAQEAAIGLYRLTKDPLALESLVHELGSEDHRVHSAARFILSRDAASQLAPQIVDRLGSWFGEKREAALGVLARTGMPDDHCRDLLGRLDEGMGRDDPRLAMVRVLPRLNPDKVVPPLLERLARVRAEPVGDYQRYAAALVRTLGQLGDARAIPPLTAILEDRTERPQLRQAALQALVWLEAPALKEILPRLARDPKSMWIVSECRPEDLRLVVSDPVALFSAIVDSSADSSIVANAAYALGRTGDRRALAPLRAVAYKYRNAVSGTQQQGVKTVTLSALGALRDTSSVPFLIELVTAGKSDYPAIRALGEIGDPRAKEPLARLFGEAVSGSEEQQTLAVALGKLGDPAAIPFLKEQLKSAFHGDTSEPSGAFYVDTQQAAEALSHVGAPAVPVLLDALDWQYEHVAPYAAQALGHIGDRGALEPLAGLLHRRDYRARHDAATALGDLGDPAAISQLVRALSDEKDWVRVASAEALWRLGERSHLPVMIEVLRHGEDDWDRAQAAAALGRIRDPQALAALKEARRDPAFEVRWAARQALAGAAPE